MRRFGMVVLLCAAVVALAMPASAGDDAGMKELTQQWMNAFNSGDDAAVAAMYMKEGFRMPPNAETVHGRDGITAELAADRKMGVAKVKLEFTNSCGSGDHASMVGTYAILDADGNELDHGKWMNAIHKVDGKWMIEGDIWNSDLPPKAAGASSG